ncbi:MAG: hypothetical protein KC442_22535 [Thermomicrobiales bacterium]|nr:hypothetical protein [Thermomicrobiales bacterium]
MEDARFDHLARSLSGPRTRRGALSALLTGALTPLLPAAALADPRQSRRQASGETWRKRPCPSGLTKCKIRKGKKKKLRCVDTQHDAAHCGACGHACAAGQSCLNGSCSHQEPTCSGCRTGATCEPGTTAQHCGAGGVACQVCTGDECNEPVCDNGVCATTPLPGKACNNDTGICDASGRCQPAVCAGKNSPNPCFERDAATCNDGGSTCRCGASIEGINGCFQNAYCNNPPEQDCTSNADCEASFGKGSICFDATLCCLGKTGCTTPCPNPVS